MGKYADPSRTTQPSKRIETGKCRQVPASLFSPELKMIEFWDFRRSKLSATFEERNTFL